MREIFKIFYFNYYFITIKIFKTLINMIFIMSLSSCSILYLKKNKNFLKKNNNVENNQFTKKIQNNSSNQIKNYHHKICTGDKINSLLKKSGVSQKEIFQLIEKDKNLNKLKAGQYIFWTTNQSGKLLTLKWNISNFQNKIYIQKNIPEKSFLIIKNIFIQKNSNFFQSAYKSGLQTHEINSIIQTIQWQTNLHKLNTGSIFRLLFIHHCLQNKNILLGIKIDNLKQRYYFIRASNGDFYNINNINKNNDYINYSYLKKYRISSEFNLHRVNPVTHVITRHLGIDLAMPEDTPILATSNGKVTVASFNKIAGLYITLQNKQQYKTRYMHLKKILVSLGDTVQIGQKIALSGNTGRTTGPHLHYEIWFNNQPINPVNSQFIFSMQLTQTEKKQYIQESKKILQYLY